MSIKGNVGQAVLGLAAFGDDSTVIDFSDRVAITAMSLHNTVATDRTVHFFESPDTTSASGTRIAVHTLPAGESVDLGEIIGQGYLPTQNIIAVVQTVGIADDLNVKLTYILYTGSS